MEATFLSSAIPRLPFRPFPAKPTHHSRNGLPAIRKLVVNAKQGHETDQGESIDESSIFLRMRIKKIKNQNQVRITSSDSSEWEKESFTHLLEDASEGAGTQLLQSYFMNTGPSVALGVLALVAICVPFPKSVVFANALKAAKGLLARCHVCIDIDF